MEKLNIAELLRDCPKGMELDCTMFDNVTFVGVNAQRGFPIEIKVDCSTKYLTKEGCFHSLDCIPSAKCVIFPKGKTTWKGFQRPFKDGDVVITTSNAICIYKSIHKAYKSKNFIDFYCGYRSSDNQFVIKDYNDSHFGPVSNVKLATKEETEKLFQAIKNNGYKWNPKTKTLEKLPKFKVGDKIKMKARVKGTTAIIDVEFNAKALREGYPPYYAGGGIYYYPEQLVWIDNIDSTEPDYWEKLKHQYAGMAMQGLLTNPKLCEIETSISIASTATTIASTLINKLKEESKCEK